MNSVWEKWKSDISFHQVAGKSGESQATPSPWGLWTATYAPLYASTSCCCYSARVQMHPVGSNFASGMKRAAGWGLTTLKHTDAEVSWPSEGPSTSAQPPVTILPRVPSAALLMTGHEQPRAPWSEASVSSGVRQKGQVTSQWDHPALPAQSPLPLMT